MIRFYPEFFSESRQALLKQEKKQESEYRPQRIDPQVVNIGPPAEGKLIEFDKKREQECN